MAFEESLMFNIMRELSCHSKKSGNMCRLETDYVNSVHKFGDSVGDKHSFR